MFSDFGTALRRRRLYALACLFHEKARGLDPKDEHILFNLARALYDGGNSAEAEARLREALKMAPNFQSGNDFLEFIAPGRRE
jgi:tetratricopeptide (TPR) repeat protein